jgi:hypothetical protein
MDIVILNYMRSLRVVALVTFIGLCGPILVCTYFWTRPKPPVSAKKLNELFLKVTLDELYQLREKNYRHNATQADNEVPIAGVDETCCICMDDFK